MRKDVRNLFLIIILLPFILFSSCDSGGGSNITVGGDGSVGGGPDDSESSDASLSSLTVSAGSLIPAFDPAKTSYYVRVENSVTSVAVNASATDSGNAVVAYSPSAAPSLAVGDNTIIITVTAEDGTTADYTIKVNRWGADYVSSYAGNLKYVVGGSFAYTVDSTNTPKGTTTLTKPFYIGESEITKDQYMEVMGLASFDSWDGVSDGIVGDNPVKNINWYNAIAFCNMLSIKESLTPVYKVLNTTDPDLWDGTDDDTVTVPTASDSDWDAVIADWDANGYRLPTVLEWTWAAMGADTSNPGQFNSDGIRKRFAGDPDPDDDTIDAGDYMWYAGNSGSKTHPIKQKNPNEIGLYDMSGNVYDWLWDWLSSDGMYIQWDADGKTDYKGLDSGVTYKYSHGGAYRVTYNAANPLNNPFSMGCVHTTSIIYKAAAYAKGIRIVKNF